MTGSPVIAVTAPAFCRSKALRDELTVLFPSSVFNPSSEYFSEDDLIRFLSNAEAAIVGRDPVTEKVIASLPDLRIVAKYGVGLDNINSSALEKYGIALGWTPGVNKRSVAEMTLCFMLGLARNIFSAAQELKSGRWNKNGGFQLTGKTVGIVGFGHIGKEVARLLRPFDCRILVQDIINIAEQAELLRAEVCGFDELIKLSDFVTLHVPLTSDTRHMMDSETLHRMKKSAFLINTSRGEIVDQGALKQALVNGVIAGVALDVFFPEPPEDLEFITLPNLISTPHTGGNSIEAVEAMGRSAIGHLCDFFSRD